MNRMYSEHERQKIANEEYSNYLVSDPFRIVSDNGKKETFGTVRQVVTDETGLKAYVVESLDKKTVSVLYRGSEGPGEKGSKADWVENDIPMAKNILTGHKEATPQLESAAKTLNQVLKNFPNAEIAVYGHSLGSMNAQYALANVSDVNRISGAYIYQGPNVYPILTNEQRARVDALKYRIHNFIDQRDIVPLGYVAETPRYKPELNSQNAIGIVHHVDSKMVLNPIDQHMWSGYQWNSDGSLKIKKDTSSREIRYSDPLDAVASGMYQFSTFKAERSKHGLTSNEEFFLDSTQSTVIARGLVNSAEIVKEEVGSAKERAVEEAETLYQSTKIVPLGITELSPYEIQEAYEEAGVTYDSIVGKTERHFDEKVNKVEEIVTAFMDLEANIQVGVNEALAQDASLARKFEEWSVN